MGEEGPGMEMFHSPPWAGWYEVGSESTGSSHLVNACIGLRTVATCKTL